MADAINNSPPKTILHTPSPLTDRAIGLIKSLPKPSQNSPKGPVLLTQNSSTNKTFEPTPKPFYNYELQDCLGPATKQIPIQIEELNNEKEPEEKRGIYETGGTQIGLEQEAGQEGSESGALLVEVEPEEEFSGSEPEVEQTGYEPEVEQIGYEPEVEQIGYEPELEQNKAEPTENGVYSEQEEEAIEYEDMQEEDYQIYEEYKANHQADYSALAQHSSINQGEPEIIG